MVCDWRSFSRKWGRKVKESNLVERMMVSDNVILHSQTREELENFIKDAGIYSEIDNPKFLVVSRRRFIHLYKAIIDEDTYMCILEERHAQELYELINSSRVSIRQWLEFPDMTHSVDDSKAFINRSLHRFANNNGYWAGIWHKGQIAGSIGFLRIDWDARRTEIGYWLVATYNMKSRAIPERLGFTQEGTIRNYELLHNQFLDRVIYGLLKDEWQQ